VVAAFVAAEVGHCGLKLINGSIELLLRQMTLSIQRDAPSFA